MVHFRFPIRQLPVALQDFATEMETIVDHVLNQSECKADGCECPPNASAYIPAMDILEHESQYTLLMDLPGVSLENVKIEMQEDRLVVSGTRNDEKAAEGVSIHRQERTVGAFSRTVRLPKQLDVDKIEATFDNGVLNVTLPKLAKPSPRTIEIKNRA